MIESIPVPIHDFRVPCWPQGADLFEIRLVVVEDILSVAPTTPRPAVYLRPVKIGALLRCQRGHQTCLNRVQPVLGLIEHFGAVRLEHGLVHLHTQGPTFLAGTLGPGYGGARGTQDLRVLQRGHGAMLVLFRSAILFRRLGNGFRGWFTF